MVYFGIAVDLGGCVGIVVWYVEFEFVSGVFPVAGVGGYGYLEDG
jgi:hypothetical protein